MATAHVQGVAVRRLCSKCLGLAIAQVERLKTWSKKIHDLGLTQDQYTDVMTFVFTVSRDLLHEQAKRLADELRIRFAETGAVPLDELLRMLEAEAKR